MTLRERLSQQIQDCLDGEPNRADVVQALLETIDETYRDAEIDAALSSRLQFSFDEPAAPAATPAPVPELDPGLGDLPAVVFVTDDEGVIQECRGGDLADLVRPPEEFIGRRLTRCPVSGRQFKAAMERVQSGETTAIVEYALPRDGGLANFEARVFRPPTGGFLAVVRNVTPTAGATEPMVPAVGETLSLLQAAFDATADGILVVDLEGNFVASNRIFHEMWRIPRFILQRGSEKAVATVALSQLKYPQSAIEKALAIHGSVLDRTTDVLHFHDGRCFECVSMLQRIDGRNVGRVWSFRDVTDRVRVEQRTRYNAYHDSLTRLPNRALFQDRLNQEVGRARRVGTNTAILLLDVDRFKTVNDTLGHAAGDMLLVEVAKRLKSRQRAGDTIARLGGDEFVFIVSNLRRKEDATIVAEQILEALRSPIQIGEHELHVSASVGIAIFPEDGTEGAALLKSADMALYRAKELGRDNYQVFESKLNQRVMARLVVEKDLRRAIHENEFVLHYQPQYDLKTGKMRGVEALVRWMQGGDMVSPARFIPIAEECGLVVPLGSWVLKEAVRQCVEFNKHSPEPLRICVNVSALQIQRPNFANEVATVLQEAGLPATQLVVELTESALMQNPEQGSYGMEQLQQMGVGIAMDDFGTGHSSLNYVSVLPIALIKIDRSFVQKCVQRNVDAAVLSAIITMGHALGLKVLAEGVETEEQTRLLRALGCDEVQGYFYSRPVPAEQLLAMFHTVAGQRG